MVEFNGKWDISDQSLCRGIMLFIQSEGDGFRGVFIDHQTKGNRQSIAYWFQSINQTRLTVVVTVVIVVITM